VAKAQFSPRQQPKQRASGYQVEADTTGMDPEMIGTIRGMRGPGGGGTLAGTNDIFAGVKKWFKGLAHPFQNGSTK
jgi:hypothetical protein